MVSEMPGAGVEGPIDVGVVESIAGEVLVVEFFALACVVAVVVLL